MDYHQQPRRRLHGVFDHVHGRDLPFLQYAFSARQHLRIEKTESLALAGRLGRTAADHGGDLCPLSGGSFRLYFHLFE